MQELPTLLGILAALTVGAMSPGPSFVVVARTAVSSSRADGLAAALGMGAGGLAFAAFSPAAPALGFNLAVIALVFFIEAGWYALVLPRQLAAKSSRLPNP